MDIKTAALFLNSSKEQSLNVYKNVVEELEKENIEHYALDSYSFPSDIKPGTDIMFCLGGDGTLLKAARTAADKELKIVGINGGTLGFLSGVDPDVDFCRLLENVRKDNYYELKRLMLDISVFRENKQIFRETALNECVIKTAEQRAISINVFYNDCELKEYFGDGIIIATPTGSTAYSLAAGGPIVYPEIDVFILTPICPHTLTQRPLVLPSNNTLRARLSQRKTGLNVSLNLDGQINLPLGYEDDVIVSQSSKSISILYPGQYNFFNVLTGKLKWGSR
jgi:NAD+ kinase